MFGEVIFSRYNDKEILCVYGVSKSIWINRQEIYFIRSSQIIGTHQQAQFTALLYSFQISDFRIFLLIDTYHSLPTCQTQAD